MPVRYDEAMLWMHDEAARFDQRIHKFASFALPTYSLCNVFVGESTNVATRCVRCDEARNELVPDATHLDVSCYRAAHGPPKQAYQPRVFNRFGVSFCHCPATVPALGLLTRPASAEEIDCTGLA